MISAPVLLGQKNGSRRRQLLRAPITLNLSHLYKRGRSRGVCDCGTKPHSRYYTLLSVTYNTLFANTLQMQLPLSSKQALRNSSGSLKERTEEPLGNLNKVYRAQFAWPTL